jgi:biopolymer transport protein ExbB
VNTVEAVKDLLLDSGAGWVLWLLGILSLVSVAIIVERWLFYRTRGGNVREMAEALDRRLDKGEIEEAIGDLEASRSVAASIAIAGLRLGDRGPAAADKAMQSAVALERSHLERYLAYLGTLGNNAPFVGLFGTVIGVIHAFESLGADPTHAHAAEHGQLASQAVMTSVAEALVATAVGILVALPAVAAYNYFQRRVNAILSASDVLSNLVLAYLVPAEAPVPEKE